MAIAEPPSSAPAFQPRKPDNLRGALLLLLAISMASVETTIVRWTAPRVDTSQVVMFRGIGQFIVILVWSMMRGALPNLRSGRLNLHLWRGVTSVSSWWLYYYTFQKLGMALATLLTFAASLFIVVMAGPVMGERVRLVSWITTLLGFAGIALASGAGSLSYSPEVLLGLLAAAISAILIFQTRALAQTEDPLTIMTYIGLVVLVATTPAVILYWQPLLASDAALLMVAGLLGAFAMLAMISAYAVGETAALAPVPFVRLAIAMAIGLVLFGEVPGWEMLTGSAIVVGSALYAMRAEQVRRRR